MKKAVRDFSRSVLTVSSPAGLSATIRWFQVQMFEFNG